MPAVPLANGSPAPARRLDRASAAPEFPVLQAVGSAVERILDSADKWLTGLPANPLTDFLAGAVWLVRRTLFPVGAGVLPGGEAGCVATKDCSGQDLQGVDLSGQDLTGVNFQGANLNRANLYGSVLKGDDLSGATLEHANLTLARLDGANLSGADLRWAHLGRARLYRAVLVDAFLDGAYMRQADLARANLYGVRAPGANLFGAFLYGADFTYAELSHTDLRFSYADDGSFGRTNFSYATLYGALVNTANWEPGPIFDSTVCPNGSYSSTTLLACRA